MRGVTITDRKNGNRLAIDLVDILRQIDSFVENTEWEIVDVECFGSAADKLHHIADINARVSAQTLLQLSANLTQVIEGVFTGYRYGESQPWIIIAAVDSSAYDVESSDEALLAQLRQHFKQVVELP